MLGFMSLFVYESSLLLIHNIYHGHIMSPFRQFFYYCFCDIMLIVLCNVM